MADPTKRGRQDNDLINTRQEYELSYWQRYLGVSRQELLAAFKAVGNSASKVRQHLRK
jgi:uncharacterized protein DUF3606